MKELADAREQGFITKPSIFPIERVGNHGHDHGLKADKNVSASVRNYVLRNAYRKPNSKTEPERTSPTMSDQSAQRHAGSGVGASAEACGAQ